MTLGIYILDMLKSIKTEASKYEPNRKPLMSLDEFGKDIDTEDDLERSYERYVEKEYMYFRAIAEHYFNKSKNELNVSFDISGQNYQVTIKTDTQDAFGEKPSMISKAVVYGLCQMQHSIDDVMYDMDIELVCKGFDENKIFSRSDLRPNKSENVTQTKEQKLSRQFGIKYSDLIEIQDYPLATYAGAEFYWTRFADIYSWVPSLHSSNVNAGEWRKESERNVLAVKSAN